MNAGGGTSSTSSTSRTVRSLPKRRWARFSIVKYRELIDRCPLGAQPIDGRGVVAETYGHATEQHQRRLDAEEFPDFFVPYRPRLLRAGLQSALARQQHDALYEHAEVGPLRGSHGAVHEEKHRGRRTEEIEVATELPAPRHAVFPLHAHVTVHDFTPLMPPRS